MQSQFFMLFLLNLLASLTLIHAAPLPIPNALAKPAPQDLSTTTNYGADGHIIGGGAANNTPVQGQGTPDLQGTVTNTGKANVQAIANTDSTKPLSSDSYHTQDGFMIGSLSLHG